MLTHNDSFKNMNYKLEEIKIFSFLINYNRWWNHLIWPLDPRTAWCLTKHLHWAPNSPVSNTISIKSQQNAKMKNYFTFELKIPVTCFFNLAKVEGLSAPDLASSIDWLDPSSCSILQKWDKTETKDYGLILILGLLDALKRTYEASTPGRRDPALSCRGSLTYY